MLSGGEKARLALAKFMLSAGTLLVLDEPTNHLDIPSKEMLEDALLAFDGSVIAVTHDRYFLRRTMTRIVTVRALAALTDGLQLCCSTSAGVCAASVCKPWSMPSSPLLSDNTALMPCHLLAVQVNKCKLNDY